MQGWRNTRVARWTERGHRRSVPDRASPARSDLLYIQNSVFNSSAHHRADTSLSEHEPGSGTRESVATSDTASDVTSAPSTHLDGRLGHETASPGSRLMDKFAEEGRRIRDELFAGRPHPNAGRAHEVATEEGSATPASSGHVVSAYTPPPKPVSDPTSYLPYTGADVQIDPPDSMADGAMLGLTALGAGSLALAAGEQAFPAPQLAPLYFLAGAVPGTIAHVVADDSMGVEVGGMEPDPTHPLYPVYFGDDGPAPAPAVPGRTEYVTREPGTQSPTAEEGTRTQEVEVGDTLGSIARENGVSVEELAAANGISDPDRITAGQVLEIPEPGTTEPASPTPSREPARGGGSGNGGDGLSGGSEGSGGTYGGGRDSGSASLQGSNGLHGGGT